MPVSFEFRGITGLSFNYRSINEAHLLCSLFNAGITVTDLPGTFFVNLSDPLFVPIFASVRILLTIYILCGNILLEGVLRKGFMPNSCEEKSGYATSN